MAFGIRAGLVVLALAAGCSLGTRFDAENLPCDLTEQDPAKQCLTGYSCVGGVCRAGGPADSGAQGGGAGAGGGAGGGAATGGGSGAGGGRAGVDAGADAGRDAGAGDAGRRLPDGGLG